MQEIAIEIDAQRVGRASGYLGGLTIERYTFTGATIPAGTRLAILTRAGVTIAASEITEGNAATVDTNTQEVADLLRYQPIGACETVYITLGDADNILAIIPATMRKNWLDDEAAHPPVPANRYPTKTELDQWLARFDENAAATAAAQSAAEAAATSATNSATKAEQNALAAGLSATGAANSALAADESKRAAETAQSKAETAKSAAETAAQNAAAGVVDLLQVKVDAAESAQGAAETAQGAAQAAATSAGESAKVASASEQAALSAKQTAETAQVQAKASETAAKASEASAKVSETAASASEQAAKASEQAVAKSETAAAESANAAKASETAAAESATSASASATAANASANAASSSATAAAKSAAASDSSASAAAKSATDLAEAVATANSLGGRLTAVENGLSGCVNLTVVDRSLSTGAIYPSWYGTAGQLGVPSSTRFTSCVLAEITLWKNGSDYRNINMLVVYYYDESAGVWKVWGRSETLSSNPSSAYPNGYKYTFHFMKDGSAPWLTVNTKIFLAFKQNTDATFGTGMINLAMHGRGWNFGENGYGVCSGWPNAAGEATGIKNQDWCRVIGYFYVDAAGARVDAVGARVDAVGANVATVDMLKATDSGLDRRITSLENKGIGFKEDKRIVTSELKLPLVKQNVSPYGILYGPNGKTTRYFCNCYSHVFQESTVAHVYSLTGSYIGSLNNVGFNFAPANDYVGAGCLVAITKKYMYGIFNGFAYSNNNMIISKFEKDNGAPLIKSRTYSRRGTVGSIWQNAGYNHRHAVGPVVWNIKTDHILVFGMYYTNAYNDNGDIVDKKLGYGYIVFDEDLNFVKWDEASGGFVSSEAFDETYLTLLPNASENAIVGFWNFDYWNITKELPTIVAITQKTSGTNGLGYLGAHDEIVPMTLQGGNPYYSSDGLDYIPLGGNRLSVDNNGLFTDYLPYLIFSRINSDSEDRTARNLCIFNGSRYIVVKLTISDDDIGFTYCCSENYNIPYTAFTGHAISSSSSHMLLLGKWSSSYSNVPLFLYYDSYIYHSSGHKIIAQAVGLVDNCKLTSPQRGGYAREYHIKFAPCGHYISPTGGYFLNI